MAEPSGGKAQGQSSFRRVLTTVSRVWFPFLILVMLLAVWSTTMIRDRNYDSYDVLLFAIIVGSLFYVLFQAEALEIAYSVLRDKHKDEFGKPDGKLMEEMRAREDLVYEAREWLVIGIVTVITLTTSEFKEIYLPFRSTPLRDLSLRRLGLPGYIVPHIVFSLMFTTFPVMWFAQGPGKAWAKRSPQEALIRSSGVWRIIGAVGKVVEWTRLNELTDLTANLVGSGDGPKVHLRPSDEGFFLTSLHRYGFGLHDLSITVHIEDDGSCRIIQKSVIYLLRYTRNNFSRWLYADSPADPAGSRFTRVTGRKCSIVYGNYDSVEKELSDISAPAKPGDKDQQFCDKVVRVDAKDTRRVYFAVETWEKLPTDGEAFAIAAECQAEWGANAYKAHHGEPDGHDMIFDYPCRSYELTISAGPNVHFTQIEAVATFMGNPHQGEKRRLEDALQPGTEKLHSILPYPLPGAKYAYTWKIARV